MSDRPGITSELRSAFSYEMATSSMASTSASIDAGKLMDLCDAIDSVHATLEAEHEKAMIRAGQLLDDAEKERDYNYANWQECKQKVLQGNITFDELERENESLKAELDRAHGEWDFWESTHVELPKDADGEPVRIGDVMEWSDGTTFEVVGIGDDTLFYVETDENGSNSIEWTSCNLKRHHNAPATVEGVLLEFVQEWWTAPREKDGNELLTEYAKRLALAGDAE